MGLILLSGAALGAEAGNDLRRRHEALRELRMLMELLKGELQYGGAPLSDVFFRLSEKWKSTLGRFFLETAREMEQVSGRSLKEILEKTKHDLSDTGLSEEQQEALMQICALLGEADRETQIHALESYLFSIRQEEEIALEGRRQKEAMYRFLGIMGGVFFAVLLY